MIRVLHIGGTNMSARATWAATAVGTAIGTGGWIFGVGHLVWPEHPGWALLLLTLAATIATQVGVEREVRNARRAQG
jgi:hypothetical protein